MVLVYSHASIQRAVVLTELVVEIEFWSFFGRDLRDDVGLFCDFLGLFLGGLFFGLFFVLLFIVLVVLFILLLIFPIFADLKLLLNLLNEGGYLFLWYFALLQYMWVL